MVTFEEFQKLDIRVGKIVAVEDFPEAKKRAYKITVDFGKELGIKKSSVQIVQNYKKEQLLGQLVFCVVNLPSRKIGPFLSEVLTLGIPDKNKECVLLQPERDVPLGGRVY